MRIVIDGNIGAGKTTQLDLLASKGWCVRREPVDQWPLEDFAKDPSRWAFYFHMKIMQTCRPVITFRHVIYERSLQSSRWVFWPTLSSIVTPQEENLYDHFYQEYAWFPDLYIYLDKPPDLAYEHIQKRTQAGDSYVSKPYLEQLDRQYNTFLQALDCTVIRIDATQSVDKIHQDICDILVKHELFVRDTFRE